MESVIDLIIKAAEDKEMMDKFRNAKDAKALYSALRPYSISEPDCAKLIKARDMILDTLKDRRGCY